MDKKTHVTETLRLSDAECGRPEVMALCLVNACVRNSLEDLHAGIFPSSESGDFTDVKVVSPYGEIPWNQVGSHLGRRNEGAYDHHRQQVFTFLLDPDRHMNFFNFPPRWTKPVVDREM